MATLQQTIRTGSGQLEKVSGLDSAINAGLQAPPTTPMGMAGLPDTNPDVAKMAGVKNQKSTALRMSIQGQDDLGTRQRTTQSRTAGSVDENKQLSLAEQLSKTGGLQARVPTMVANLVSQASTAGAQAPTAVNLTTDAGINTSIQKLLANPLDYASAKLLADQLGLPAPSDLPSMTAFTKALEGKIPGFAEVASASALQGAQGALKLTTQDWQSLGFVDENQVAQLLGILPEDLAGMNIGQVVDSIQTEIYKDFQEVGSWEQRANDPTLGATERAEARSHLRDLGSVGVRSATAGMDKLADDLISAKQVEINGQFVGVQDLLDSEYVSGLAKSYLEGSDEFRAEFSKNEPDLSKFFDQYKDIISEVVKDVDEGMQNYANLQMANAAMAKTSTGSVISDGIMKAIFPGWGTGSVTSITPDVLPNGGAVLLALQGKTGLSETEINDLYYQIESLGRGDPTFAAELISTFTEDDLRRYGLLNRGSEQMKKLERNLQAVADMKRLGPGSSLDEMARVTGARSAMELNELKQQVDEMTRSGMFPPLGFDTQNVRGESLRASIEQMKQRMPTTLREIAEFQNQAAAVYDKLKEYAAQQKAPEYQALQPYLSVGGTINSQAAADIVKNVDLDTLGKIITQSKFGTVFTTEAQSQLINSYQTQYTMQNLTPIFKKYANPSTNWDQIKNQTKNFNGDVAKTAADWMANTQSLVDMLKLYRDGNVSAQVGPMASKFSSYLTQAESDLADGKRRLEYYMNLPGTPAPGVDVNNMSTVQKIKSGIYTGLISSAVGVGTLAPAVFGNKGAIAKAAGDVTKSLKSAFGMGLAEGTDGGETTGIGYSPGLSGIGTSGKTTLSNTLNPTKSTDYAGRKTTIANPGKLIVGGK